MEFGFFESMGGIDDGSRFCCSHSFARLRLNGNTDDKDTNLYDANEVV